MSENGTEYFRFKIVYRSLSEVHDLRSKTHKRTSDSGMDAMGEYVDEMHTLAGQIQHSFPDVRVVDVVWRAGFIVISLPGHKKKQLMESIQKTFGYRVERIHA